MFRVLQQKARIKFAVVVLQKNRLNKKQQKLCGFYHFKQYSHIPSCPFVHLQWTEKLLPQEGKVIPGFGHAVLRYATEKGVDTDRLESLVLQSGCVRDCEGLIFIYIYIHITYLLCVFCFEHKVSFAKDTATFLISLEVNT